MNQVHKMSLKRNLQYSYFILLFILITPLIGLLLFIYSSQNNPIGLLKGVSIGIIITAMGWLPGLLIHLSYYKNDKGKQITITKTGISFSNFSIKEIRFKDILQLEQISSSDFSKLPWGDYGFTKIILKDNSIIKITCLTIDLFDLALEISRHSNYKIEKRSSAFPYLASS